MKTIKKYKFEIAIVIITLIIIEIVNYVFQLRNQNIIYPDSITYCEAAKNVYKYHSGHIYRPILLAAIQGLPYLFGYTDAHIFDFAFYLNLFSWLFTQILFYKILKNYFSAKSAFYITIILNVFVGILVNLFHLFSETVYVFFIVSALYFLVKYENQKNIKHLLYFVAILLLSMLVKPSSKLIGFAVLLYYTPTILKHCQYKATWTIYVSMVLIGFQLVVSKVNFGNYTLTYIDAVTYYNYLGTKATCFEKNIEFSQNNNKRADYIFSLENNPPKMKQIATEDILHQIKFNIDNLIMAYFSNIYDNVKTGNNFFNDIKNIQNNKYFETLKNIAYLISKWENRIFSILAMFLGSYYIFLNRKYKTLTFIGIYCVYTILISGVSCSQGDRFHLVIFPFVLILVAVFIKQKFFAPLQK